MAKFVFNAIGFSTALYDLADGDRVTRRSRVPSAHCVTVDSLGEIGNIALVIFRDIVTPVVALLSAVNYR